MRRVIKTEKEIVERRIDQYKIKWSKLKEKYRASGIPKISKENSDLILQYLRDMEIGANVGINVAKGPRSPRRLFDLAGRMIFFAKKFEELYSIKDFGALKESHVMSFFYGMQEGEILKKGGLKYSSVETFVKIFKSFWHWYIKMSKKDGVVVEDITKDVNAQGEKPEI